MLQKGVLFLAEQQPPLVEEGDIVAQLLQVAQNVGGDQDGVVLLPGELVEDLQHLVPDDGVQAGSGLVQHQQPGAVAQGHGDGQGAEGDVAEAIADHGVPLQYQGDPQQRGAEAYQRPGDQGPLHKGIGQHQGQAHSSTSRNRRPWGEAR